MSKRLIFTHVGYQHQDQIASEILDSPPGDQIKTTHQTSLRIMDIIENVSFLKMPQIKLTVPCFEHQKDSKVEIVADIYSPVSQFPLYRL